MIKAQSAPPHARAGIPSRLPRFPSAGKWGSHYAFSRRKPQRSRQSFSQIAWSLPSGPCRIQVPIVPRTELKPAAQSLADLNNH